MAQTQMMEGTTEEVTRLLQQGYAGQKLRVFVEPEEDSDAARQDTPPFTVRDAAHLETMLLEGLDSPARPLTDDTLEQMRQEVRTRLAQKLSPKQP